MYSGATLVELLAQKEAARSRSDLFRHGDFQVRWRAKVGYFPHPDGETIISAGEPAGPWPKRPETKRNVSDNIDILPQLPLNGYIPASSIRGLVRAWAKQQGLGHRVAALLGNQDNDQITAGKIEFFDAWPQEATPLTLDIVNPQENFQVFHEGQGTPLSFYTLGEGEEPLSVKVAIRGIPGVAQAAEVEEVWGWIENALSTLGVGSRTASGYGQIEIADRPQQKPVLPAGWQQKILDFRLYSQGCYGADQDPRHQLEELRPTHWRGWLRSWMLRFLLGVMSPDDAKQTLGELMGVLEPSSLAGCVRTNLIPGRRRGKRSDGSPQFFGWQGQLAIAAPEWALDPIVMPVVRFAVSCGGVGRGWRRPLHIYLDHSGNARVRGAHLVMTQKHWDAATGKDKNISLQLPLKPSQWTAVYDNWVTVVKQRWPQRVRSPKNPAAEAFSPTSCSVYLVLGPDQNPLDLRDWNWLKQHAEDTRGDGMALIYQPQYKRKPDLGGNAASGSSYCSWASIRRLDRGNPDHGVECQEVVCLFMGGVQPNQANHLRSHFLQDLAKQEGCIHLFGIQP